MIECGIYVITNTINGKQYIGQSNDIRRRWWEHKARAFDENNNCYHKPLYCAFRKYGLQNFTFEVLEYCDIQHLNKSEKDWIQKLHTIAPKGYNILGESIKERTAEDIAAYEQGKTVKQLHFGCCSDCGKPLAGKTISGLCSKCYPKHARKAVRPDAHTLYELLLHNSFEAVGRMYGVTGKAIQKWCQGYGMPDHARDYKQLNMQV